MDFRAPCGELAAGNRSKSFRAAKGYYFKIQDINIASVIPDNNQMCDLRACILYMFWEDCDVTRNGSSKQDREDFLLECQPWRVAGDSAGCGCCPRFHWDLKGEFFQRTSIFSLSKIFLFLAMPLSRSKRLCQMIR